MKNEDPLSPLVEAIAQRVATLLEPKLTQAHAVKPRLLTVAQAAVYIGRTEKSVYMLQANGAFPSVRADSRVMFDLMELVIYLTQVTARSCGCERPDSRGGMGHQAVWSHGKRLERCPRAQAIVVGLGALRVAPWVRTSRHAHSKGSPSPDHRHPRPQPVVAT